MINLLEESHNNKFLVVDLFTNWCIPCKSVSSSIDDLKGVYSEVKFMKIDAEENADLANSLEMSSVPTLLFYKNGELMDRICGAISKQKLTERIEALIH